MGQMQFWAEWTVPVSVRVLGPSSLSNHLIRLKPSHDNESVTEAETDIWSE